MEACGATDRPETAHESKRVNCSWVIMRKLQEERDAKYHISRPPPPVEVTSRNQEADIFMEADRLVVVEFTMTHMHVARPHTTEWAQYR
jgi:hypothetical protein